MKRGVPPTARKARTAELTPPTRTFWARSNSAALLLMGLFRQGRRARRDGPIVPFWREPGQRDRRPAGHHSARAGRRGRVREHPAQLGLEHLAVVVLGERVHEEVRSEERRVGKEGR